MQTTSQAQTIRSFRAVMSRREAMVSGGGAAFGIAFVPGATAASAQTPAATGERVPIYRGDAARTGVMPGPAPDGEPGELWRAQASGEVGTAIARSAWASADADARVQVRVQILITRWKVIKAE